MFCLFFLEIRNARKAHKIECVTKEKKSGRNPKKRRKTVRPTGRERASEKEIKYIGRTQKLSFLLLHRLNEVVQFERFFLAHARISVVMFCFYSGTQLKCCAFAAQIFHKIYIFIDFIIHLMSLLLIWHRFQTFSSLSPSLSPSFCSTDRIYYASARKQRRRKETRFSHSAECMREK